MAEQTLREIFAKQLNYHMKHAGKTQADLCKFMNVSSATASDWCNANKMPRADKIQSIAKWLGVEIGDLMEESTEENYYYNTEIREIAEEIYKKDRILLDAYRSSSKDRLIAYAKKLEELRKMEEGDV